jgi:hypothetical protein
LEPVSSLHTALLFEMEPWKRLATTLSWGEQASDKGVWHYGRPAGRLMLPLCSVDG